MDHPNDWLAVLDHIADFEIEKATLAKWHEWVSQLNIVLRATAFDRLPNSQKVAILMMKCKGFIPVWNILGIDVDTVEHDVLVSEMVQYLNPVNARIVMRQRKQEKGESFDSFAKALEALSRPCQYRDKNIVRDVFIANMDESHDDIALAIRRKYDISLDEAVTLANAMVSRGCLSSPSEGSDILSSSPPRSTASFGTAISNRSSSWKMKMVPITSGSHDVLIIHVNFQVNTVFVCPTFMMEARNRFLEALQHSMESCKDPPVIPIKDNSYAALIECKWHRVKVLSVLDGRKATILAIDFGWTKSAPFSVFRNLPLDYRDVDPVGLSVSFSSPMSKELRENAVLRVNLTLTRNTWVASLEQQTVQSKGAYDYDKSCTNRQLTKALKKLDCSDLASDLEIKACRQTRKAERDLCGTERREDVQRFLSDTENNSSGSSTFSDWSYFDRQSGRFGTHRGSQVDEKAGRPRNQKNGHTGQAIMKTNDRRPTSAIPTSNRNPQQADYHNRKSYDSSNPSFIPRPVEQEQAVKSGNRKISSTVRLPASARSAEPVESQPPIRPPWKKNERSVPLNRYIHVHVIYVPNDKGDMYCILNDLMPSFMELSANLDHEHPEELARPQVGDLCMVRDEGDHMSRGEIVRIHPTMPKAKIRCIDFGNEEKMEFSKLFTLPQKYWDVQPYAFRAKIVNGVEVVEAMDIEALFSYQDEEGVYFAKVKTSREPSPPNARLRPVSGSIMSRSGSPARPPRPPPIPKTAFTEVITVYVGPEGCFAVETSKLPVLAEIHVQINTLPLRPLQGPPEHGCLYVVPFEGELFRAKVLDVLPNNSCKVSFVDYGNECITPFGDVKHIPDGLKGDIVTFKFRLDGLQPEPNSSLIVSPVALEPDGSWLLQLRGEPSKNGLPDVDDDAAAAFPSSTTNGFRL